MNKTRALLLLPLLTLAGCGFHSVYGAHTNDDGTPVSQALNSVTIENIKDHEGQILRNDLIDRMYGKDRSSQPLYSLKTTVHYTEQDLGILANATSTRELMDMYADYTLLDAKGKMVLVGSAHSVASFDRLDQMYGTVAARDDAIARTLHEVSEQIVNRLSVYFTELK
jgi:LPS-assembly lipoprotein